MVVSFGEASLPRLRSTLKLVVLEAARNRDPPARLATSYLISLCSSSAAVCLVKRRHNNRLISTVQEIDFLGTVKRVAGHSQPDEVHGTCSERIESEGVRETDSRA